MIATRLTRTMGLDHPIISAPMAKVGGGRLAAAVSNAGGLGLVGGGYCEPDWIEAEFQKAGNAHIGCGFITWRLAGQPNLLDAVLDRGPRAIFLSFGDPTDAGAKVKAAGVPLICQVQTLADAKLAVGAGADIIVAQGSEAGGHGDRRATMTLVPEVADWLAANAPDVLLCAAGGIADGRGLAAALMLGADGVVAGTRFWAADEALTPPAHITAGLAADGDQTIHTKVVDIARDFDWPERFNNRVLSHPFIAKWQARGAELATNRVAKDAWQTALASGDTSIASATVGEGIGLVHATAPAAKIVQDMVDEADRLLAGSWQRNG
jgi:nitronate monooxygenase